MDTSFSSINKQILEAGRKDASKFLYTYLDNEDLVIDLLKNVDGIKSDIYLNEIELNEAPVGLKQYLKNERQLLQSPLFEEWIDAHAGFGSPPATYYIIDRLEQFSA